MRRDRGEDEMPSAIDRFVSMLARGLARKSEHEQWRILRAGRRLLAERRARKERRTDDQPR